MRAGSVRRATRSEEQESAKKPCAARWNVAPRRYIRTLRASSYLAPKSRFGDSKVTHWELPAGRRREPRPPFRHGKPDKETRQSGRRRRGRHSAGTGRDARRERAPRHPESPSYRPPAARQRNPAPSALDSACARHERRAALGPRHARWRVVELGLSPRWKLRRTSRSRRQAPGSERASGLRPVPRSRASGSRTERRANSSSLLFSCTGVNSLVHLAFHGLSKGILAHFMERNAIHRNLFHASVVQLIAFPEKISARLRIGDYRDHAAGRAHNTV